MLSNLRKVFSIILNYLLIVKRKYTKTGHIISDISVSKFQFSLARIQFSLAKMIFFHLESLLHQFLQTINDERFSLVLPCFFYPLRDFTKYSQREKWTWKIRRNIHKGGCIATAFEALRVQFVAGAILSCWLASWTVSQESFSRRYVEHSL